LRPGRFASDASPTDVNASTIGLNHQDSRRLARLAYRDFRFEGRAVFAEIKPPPTDVILFEREF
jgi:hypothetical protein